MCPLVLFSEGINPKGKVQLFFFPPSASPFLILCYTELVYDNATCGTLSSKVLTSKPYLSHIRVHNSETYCVCLVHQNELLYESYGHAQDVVFRITACCCGNSPGLAWISVKCFKYLPRCIL